jgi:hypothetical protein
MLAKNSSFMRSACSSAALAAWNSSRLWTQAGFDRFDLGQIGEEGDAPDDGAALSVGCGRDQYGLDLAAGCSQSHLELKIFVFTPQGE